MIKFIKYLIGITSLIFFEGCQGNIVPSDPVKEMKKEFNNNYAYTVLLNDMDLENQTQYKHKYKIIQFKENGEYTIKTTEWKNVSDDFFAYHASNLGMEILSKTPNKKYNELPTPPGFTQIIGNPYYGKWQPKQTHQPVIDTVLNATKEIENDSIIAVRNLIQTDTLPKYWLFKSAHENLRDELELKGLSISQKEFESFKSAYFYNRPYYGDASHKDSTRYGTNSHHWYLIRPYFYQRRLISKNFEKPFSSSGNRGGGGFGK